MNNCSLLFGNFACAPTGNNLYVVEKAGMRIDLLTIEGGHQRVLIEDDLSSPSDVAVDPLTG